MPRRLVIFVGSPRAGRGGSPAWTGPIAMSRDPPSRCLGGRCGRSRVGPGIRRRDVLAADLVTSRDIQRNDTREEEQSSGVDHDLSAPGLADLPLDCFAAHGGARDRWRWAGGDAGVVMPAFLERREQEVSNRLVAPLHSLAGGNDESYSYPCSFVPERAISPILRT